MRLNISSKDDFYKKPLCSSCGFVLCLIDEPNDGNSVKLGGYNLEHIGRVLININNSLCSKLYDSSFNTEFILNCININTITTMVLIILVCIIIVITILSLILYVVPWLTWPDGKPIMPGPYQDKRNDPYANWVRSRNPNAPRPVEPKIHPPRPNTDYIPLPKKDPGKK